MKEYKTNRLRNVGLVSHGGTGKTSLAEAMLFTSGAINRMGMVDDGSTVSDYNEDEIARKISITVSLMYCDWQGYKLNIVDTPGYMDFIGEVKGALRVLDGAVVLLNATSGVEVGTEKVWQWVEEYDISRLFFINRMDREHADFYHTLKMAREGFGSGVVPIQLPLGQSGDFKGVIDLVEMRALVYEAYTGKYQAQDIPLEERDRAAEYREQLVEAVAERDDELLELYLDKGDLTVEEVKVGLRKGVISKEIFPVLCGNALGNVGTSALLDAIVDYLPSPVDVPIPGAEGEVEPNPEAPLAALVFKTIAEPHLGEMSFFRVYSGTMKSGEEVFNSTAEVTERIGQIYLMLGKQRHEVGSISAGDMGAVVKLKGTHTGDTLCDKKNPIVLPGIEFPEPVIRVAVEPRSRGDEEKINMGLSKLHEEDPSFVFEVDGELKQTVISGQGELHLEVVVDRLKRKFGVEVNLSRPRIPYRETVLGTAEVQGKYKRQSGGRGQYGDVWIRLEPLPRGTGFEFVDAIVGGVIPSKYIPAVEKGIREAMGEGVLAGYPVMDVKVTLYDGSHHPVDSSDIAFKIAGSMALKKAVSEANPILLEPIYDVEVVVPEEFVGDVTGDLSGRRGKILGIDSQGPFQVIRAKVPLAQLYRYSTTLRSLTQGRGMHTRQFSHYEEVPREISEKIIEESKKR